MTTKQPKFEYCYNTPWQLIAEAVDRQTDRHLLAVNDMPPPRHSRQRHKVNIFCSQKDRIESSRIYLDDVAAAAMLQGIGIGRINLAF